MLWVDPVAALIYGPNGLYRVILDGSCRLVISFFPDSEQSEMKESWHHGDSASGFKDKARRAGDGEKSGW